MNPAGFVLPAATIGLGALVVKPNKRGFFPSGSLPIIAQITIEEQHHDELEITEQPVEQGAPISDHAYQRPAEVRITCAWSNSPTKAGSLFNQAVGAISTVVGGAAPAIAGAPATIPAIQSLMAGNSPQQVRAVYDQLRALQSSRIPFAVFTGKRAYTNMLFKSLSVTTEQKTENALMIVAVCRQVIIVATQVVSVSGDPAVLKSPEKNAPPQAAGTVSLVPAPSISLPNAESISSSLATLQSGIGDVQTMFNQVPGGVASLSSTISGAITQLPGSLTDLNTAVSEAISELSSSAQIPLLPNAQTLSIDLGAAVGPAQAALQESLATLPAVISETNGVINGALAELPSVTAQLPAVLSNLQPSLVTVQAQMQGVLNQIPNAMQMIRNAASGILK